MPVADHDVTSGGSIATPAMSAAVVAGIRLGLLDERVDVQTHGGVLTIEWQDGPSHDAPVFMTGPATSVFDGEIDIPDLR